jgi:Uma2 family endonuclease
MGEPLSIAFPRELMMIELCDRQHLKLYAVHPELTMSGIIAKPVDKTPGSEPAWEVALLFPPQGTWSEEEYLALNTNKLVEFSDGFIEVLPMPTLMHQLIVAYLFGVLDSFTRKRRLGRAIFAPLRVRLRSKKFREPDILFMKTENSSRMGNDFWDRADLVMEVVSAENRDHDVRTKRAEYARAKIPEYWIIDPQESKITVLALDLRQKRGTYAVHGEFGPGSRASSKLLPGFEVDVKAVFSQKP